MHERMILKNSDLQQSLPINFLQEGQTVSIKSVHKQNIPEGLAVEKLGTTFLANQMAKSYDAYINLWKIQKIKLRIGIETELKLIYIHQSPYTKESLEELKHNNKWKRKLMNQGTLRPLPLQNLSEGCNVEEIVRMSAERKVGSELTPSPMRMVNSTVSRCMP